MNKIILIIISCFLVILTKSQDIKNLKRDYALLTGNVIADSVIIKKFYNEALRSGKAYEWLDTLTNKTGGRLSGSPEAAQAVDWAERVFKSVTVNVIKQECMVPHWIRGVKET